MCGYRDITPDGMLRHTTFRGLYASRAANKPLVAKSDAWILHFRRDQWEFHWHGCTGNAYEARFKGWMAWLEGRDVDLSPSNESPAYHLLME